MLYLFHPLALEGESDKQFLKLTEVACGAPEMNCVEFAVLGTSWCLVLAKGRTLCVLFQENSSWVSQGGCQWLPPSINKYGLLLGAKPGLSPTLSTSVKQAELVLHVPGILFPAHPSLLILIPPSSSCRASRLRFSYSLVSLSKLTLRKEPNKPICLRIGISENAKPC